MPFTNAAGRAEIGGLHQVTELGNSPDTASTRPATRLGIERSRDGADPLAPHREGGELRAEREVDRGGGPADGEVVPVGAWLR